MRLLRRTALDHRDARSSAAGRLARHRTRSRPGPAGGANAPALTASEPGVRRWAGVDCGLECRIEPRPQVLRDGDLHQWVAILSPPAGGARLVAGARYHIDPLGMTAAIPHAVPGSSCRRPGPRRGRGRGGAPGGGSTRRWCGSAPTRDGRSLAVGTESRRRSRAADPDGRTAPAPRLSVNRGDWEALRQLGGVRGRDSGKGPGFRRAGSAGRRADRASGQAEKGVAGPPPRREWQLHRGPPYHDRSTRHGHRAAPRTGGCDGTFRAPRRRGQCRPPEGRPSTGGNVAGPGKRRRAARSAECPWWSVARAGNGPGARCRRAGR